MTTLTLCAATVLAVAAALPAVAAPVAATASVATRTGAQVATTGETAAHRPVPQDARTTAALVRAASADTAAMAAALHLGGDTLTVRTVAQDADGATHVHVDRHHRGLLVVGGDLIVHRAPDGTVTGHDGMFDGAVTVGTTPTLTRATGQQRGVAEAKAYKARHRDHLRTAAPTGTDLVVYVSPAGSQHLAYRVRTAGETVDATPSRVNTLVDAVTGAALTSYDEIAEGTGNGALVGSVPLTTTKVATGFELRNTATGNYTTDSGNQKVTGSVMTDADDAWGDGTALSRQSAAVDAQYGADTTFAFYKSVLGRNGIWNTGQGARSRVHYDTGYQNAFWDGSQMTYGDGLGDQHPLTELDVAGHEMTHGVTQNTANLAYSGDAGGLNEATSDIFGTAVEWYANLAADTPDYLVGERLDLNGNGTPLRYMDKPSKDGRSPDCWSSSVASLDPHYSSGPLNHWFYLASEGSGTKTINGTTYSSPTCTAATVTGAGRDAVQKVWYRALSTKLTSSATYPAARNAAITSAVELYGAGSAVCKAVEDAMNAIAVPAGSASCGGATPTPTPTPTPGTSGVTNGGFEQGATGWSGTSTAFAQATAAEPARSGTGILWLGRGGARTSDAVTQQVTVPAGGRLTFWLHVDTKETTARYRYDTASVQVNSSTKASFSNLDARAGYVQKTIDLSAYAGQSVTLRLASTNDSSYPTSFVVDDVTLG